MGTAARTCRRIRDVCWLRLEDERLSSKDGGANPPDRYGPISHLMICIRRHRYATISCQRIPMRTLTGVAVGTGKQTPGFVIAGTGAFLHHIPLPQVPEARHLASVPLSVSATSSV